MTSEEKKQLDDIEEDRKRREELLIIALLLLMADAETAARNVAVLGGDIGPAIEAIILRPVSGLPSILQQAADSAFHSAVDMSGNIVPGEYEPPRQPTPDEYKGAVDPQKFADALVKRIGKSIGDDEAPTPEKIATAFDAAGVSKDNSKLLAAIATTQINAGYQPGLYSGWQANPVVTGLRFVNPDDHRTTPICHARVGVQLPKDSSWWRVNMPPLHAGNCRSSIVAIIGSFVATKSPPNLPAPQPGFGFAPAAWTHALTSNTHNLSLAMPELETLCLSGEEELSGGAWKTINGARVYMKDGVAEAGPAHLVKAENDRKAAGEKVKLSERTPHHLIGKTEAEIEQHGKAPPPEKAKPGYHRIERDAKGAYKGTVGGDGKTTHVPEHAERLKASGAPPGNTDTYLNENPNDHELAQVTTVDRNGKTQPLYSAEHTRISQGAKWEREKSLNAKWGEIAPKLAADKTEEGAALRLIAGTGLRIGGKEGSTDAAEPAYGATTLEKEHVSHEDGKATLNFVGKHAVKISHPLDSNAPHSEVISRAEGAKPGEKLYNTTDAKTRTAWNKIAGDDYYVKDLRTRMAGIEAVKAVKQIPTAQASTIKGYEDAAKTVAEHVSSRLGNTPAVAIDKYINPDHFQPLRTKLANAEQAGLIKGYAASKGLDEATAAKEWIGKHGADYRQNFNERLSAKPGKVAPLDASRFGGVSIEPGRSGVPGKPAVGKGRSGAAGTGGRSPGRVAPEGTSDIGGSGRGRLAAAGMLFSHFGGETFDLAMPELETFNLSADGEEGGLSLDAPDLEVLNLSGEGDKEPHSYSCTHVELPPDIAAKVKGIADSIDPADLDEKGREVDPHVTVKYGLDSDSPAGTKKALAGEMPARFKMGALKVFPANEKRNSDVLVAHVDSDDLERLNKKVSSATPHVDTYSEYRPHATIAYLKPGAGQKYVAKHGDDLRGMEGMASEVVHTDRYEKPTRIPLDGVSRGPTMNLSLPELEVLNLDSSEDVSGAHWVTIQHQAVKIGGGGEILEGPARLEGKKVDDLPPRDKPMTEKDHHREAGKHLTGIIEETAKGDKADHAKIAEHHAAIEKHMGHAETLHAKNDAEKSKPKSAEEHSAGPVPVDVEVAHAAKSGKLNVPVGKDGKIDPHLKAAYERHAAKHGLELGEFKDEPGGGSVTARVSPLKAPELESKAVAAGTPKVTDEHDKDLNIKTQSELTGEKKPEKLPEKTSILPDNERRYIAGQNHGSLKFASQHHEDLFDVGNARNKSFTPPKAAESRLLEHFGGDEDAMKSAADKAYNDVKDQAKGLKDGEARAVKNRILPPAPKLESNAVKNWGSSTTVPGGGPSFEPTATEKEFNARHSAHAGDVLREHLDRINNFGEANGNTHFHEAVEDYANELKGAGKTPMERDRNREAAHHLGIAAHHPVIVEHGPEGIEKAYPRGGKRRGGTRNLSMEPLELETIAA